jgi:hypothetical protein
LPSLSFRMAGRPIWRSGETQAYRECVALMWDRKHLADVKRRGKRKPRHAGAKKKSCVSAVISASASTCWRSWWDKAFDPAHHVCIGAADKGDDYAPSGKHYIRPQSTDAIIIRISASEFMLTPARFFYQTATPSQRPPSAPRGSGKSLPVGLDYIHFALWAPAWFSRRLTPAS